MGKAMSMRWTGWVLFTAGICFWTSWALMPGVGVTDAATILQLVGAQPGQVLTSSILQLLSAALLALATLGLARLFNSSGGRFRSWSVAMLAIGGCGNAADAIYHQLAYEMVRPGIDQAAMLPVMERMQSVDLLYVLPLILAFLLGCAGLAIGAARSGIVTKWNPILYLLWPLSILVGRISGIPSRIVGLTCLGLLSLSLGWIGIAMGTSTNSKSDLGVSQDEEGRTHAVPLQ